MSDNQTYNVKVIKNNLEICITIYSILEINL